MATTLADYVVIKDDSFVVSNGSPSGQVAKFTFGLPASARLNDRSVLFFRVLAKDVENLHLNVRINSHNVFQLAAAGDLPLADNSVHRIIRSGVLRGDTNTIEFLSSGAPADSATFSDVVLTFQREL